MPALFGPQWRDAGMIAPMLLPLALPFAINGFVLALLAARRRIQWQRHLALLDLGTTVLVTVLTVSHGLRWLALAYSLEGPHAGSAPIHLVDRVAGVGIRDHIRALAKPVIGAAVMGVAAAILFYAINPTSLLVITPLCGARRCLRRGRRGDPPAISQGRAAARPGLKGPHEAGPKDVLFLETSGRAHRSVVVVVIGQSHDYQAGNENQRDEDRGSEPALLNHHRRRSHFRRRDGLGDLVDDRKHRPTVLRTHLRICLCAKQNSEADANSIFFVDCSLAPIGA